jgi:catalase
MTVVKILGDTPVFVREPTKFQDFINSPKRMPQRAAIR